MPKNTFYIEGSGMKVDQPGISGPGKLYRETDRPENAKHLALEKEDPVRAAKGDLSLRTIKDFESRYNFDRSKPPFKNLKGGK